MSGDEIESYTILINDGGVKYASNPSELKRDLDKIMPGVKIKESKITVNNHLIISFIEAIDFSEFMNNKHKLFNGKSIVELNKKPVNEIVIKGITYSMATSFQFELAKAGIIKLTQMNKNNQNFRMIKGECKLNETKLRLIKEGLKLDHFIYKVEEIIKPIKPIQCYNCQQFDHMASKCPRAGQPICLKCSGPHSVKNCLQEEIRCANCGESHTSSSKECEVYSNKFDEKIRKVILINKTFDLSQRSFSDSVKNNSIMLEGLQNTIIQELKKSLESTQNNIKTEIASQISNLQTNIKKVQNELEEYKAKQIFHNIDVIKILNPSVKIDQEQIKLICESAKRHNICDVNQNSLIAYNKNSSGKKSTISYSNA